MASDKPSAWKNPIMVFGVSFATVSFLSSFLVLILWGLLR